VLITSEADLNSRLDDYRAMSKPVGVHIYILVQAGAAPEQLQALVVAQHHVYAERRTLPLKHLPQPLRLASFGAPDLDTADAGRRHVEAQQPAGRTFYGHEVHQARVAAVGFVAVDAFSAGASPQM